MNRIEARVTEIRRTENITIVSFDAQGTPMRMMALGLNLPMAAGTEVVLGIKATNIALAKELRGDLSISNRLETVVAAVENGALLASVTLLFGTTPMECITTVEASRAMTLKTGDRVTALIKASELSVLEIRKENA